MKWDSHYAIADQLYEELIRPIFPQYHKEIRDGSVYPDKQKYSLPHHFDREDDIENYIGKARSLRLKGKPGQAIFNLGIALHYLQDKWTAVNGSHEKHELYETLLTKCTIQPWETDLSIHYPILSDGAFEEFNKLFTYCDQKPVNHENLAQYVRHWKPSESNAFLDLNMAYRLSYRVAENVLQPIKN